MKGRLSQIDGANELFTSATICCYKGGDITSPVGLLISRQIKSAVGTVEDYLDRNARKRYDLNYDEITQDAQRKQIGFKIYQKLHIC